MRESNNIISHWKASGTDRRFETAIFKAHIRQERQSFAAILYHSGPTARSGRGTSSRHKEELLSVKDGFLQEVRSRRALHEVSTKRFAIT